MLQNKIGNVEYLKSNDNFLELALRHFGFNGLSIIYELLDNSVSASSTHILVGWDKSEQFKGKRTLTIKDNGTGINDPVKNCAKCFMTLGRTRDDYGTNEISHFGVGASASINELVQTGLEVEITTTDKIGRKLYGVVKKFDNGKVGFEPLTYEVNSDYESGTEIIIDGVDFKISKEQLMKVLRVVYFPAYKQSIELDGEHNFSIDFSSNEWKRNPVRKLKFSDPFYREAPNYENWSRIENQIHNYEEEFVYVDSNRKKHKMTIRARGFFPEFSSDNQELIKENGWDFKSDNFNLMLPRRNSGLYISYGGRYINLGEHYFPGPKSQTGYNLSGLRLELPISKLITDFPIKANKSDIELNNEDSRLQDLFRAVEVIQKQYLNDFKKTKSEALLMSSDKSFEFNQRLNKMLQNNNNLKTLGIRFGEILEEKRKTTTRDSENEGVKPKETGRKRKGNTPKGYQDAVDITWKRAGRGPWVVYSMDTITKTIHIEINTSTKLGESLESMSDDCKLIQCLILYCDLYSMYEKKEIEDIDIIDDYEDVNLRTTTLTEKFLLEN